MKVDAGLSAAGLGDVADVARSLEAAGYDAAWSAEISQDPFLPLGVAALATSRIGLGTSIAVAFARNPMTTAYLANDLQRASSGRFMLGLGSQIKAHITRRFSMPWGRPAAQMREYILALRAIWASWNEGAPLDFRGTYYRHTLMTAMFRPRPNPHGAPRVFLAAVGTGMTQVAGEVADGLFVHGFCTERYLREIMLPALDQGLAKSGRSRAAVEVTCPGFVLVDDGIGDLADRISTARQQIAFYGSTPAYRPVLALHGWAGLADRLHDLSLGRDEGRWAAMGELIDDDVLAAFTVAGTPAEVAGELRRRYGDVVDRATIPPIRGAGADRIRALLDIIRK